MTFRHPFSLYFGYISVFLEFAPQKQNNVIFIYTSKIYELCETQVRNFANHQ